MSYIIELNGVSKKYQGRWLYKDLNFAVTPSTATALIGPNGSGKSVLFRLICGFIKPDTGSIAIDPTFMAKNRTFPERFGVLIDSPGVLLHLSGLDNLRELARIRKVVSDERLREVMTEFGLDPNSKQKVRNYSLGMKQKLGLCQAFMESPEVLVLDEPFNALDAEASDYLHQRLRSFVENGGTVLFTSHNPEDVDRLATRKMKIENLGLVEQAVPH